MESITRTIIVLHLLPKGVKPNTKSTELCNQTQDIHKYNIKYIPVPYKRPVEYYINYVDASLVLSDSEKTVCDGMIIYAKTNGDFGIREKLVEFLLSVKTFKNTIVFYDNIFEKNKNKYIYDSDNVLRDNTHGLKILNVYAVDTDRVKRFTHNHEIIYVPIKYYEENVRPLVCTWWFRYYIGKVFGCGTGRLIQQTGTCYLNSVINGIVLSDLLSRMVLMYMNHALTEDPSIFHTIAVDITDMDMCVSRNEKLFLYRIMYNLFCKNKPKYEDGRPYRRTLDADFKKVDILKREADAFFSHSGYGDKVIEGGYEEYVLYKLFYDMGVKFVVLYNEKYYKPKYFTRIFGQQYYYEFTEFLDTLEISTEFKNVDLILYIDTTRTSKNLKSSINIKRPSTRSSPEINLNFDLETGMLRLIGPTSHTIAGYICDGYYRTYNSDDNEIAFNEWNKLEEPDIYKKILENINMSENTNFFRHVYISSAIYVNRMKKPEYIEFGKCN